MEQTGTFPFTFTFKKEGKDKGKGDPVLNYATHLEGRRRSVSILPVTLNLGP